MYSLGKPNKTINVIPIYQNDDTKKIFMIITFGKHCVAHFPDIKFINILVQCSLFYN